MPRSTIAGSCDKDMFSFVRNHQTVFQSSCTTVPSHQQWIRIPSSSTLSVVSVLDFNHFSRCITISCCFNLHFSDGIWCWASFHVLICHLCVFFCEVSIKIFGPFFKWVVFYLLSFKSSLYILDSSPLSDVSVVNIFSQPLACRLFLTLSFIEQRF